jgi:anti-sigma B factor antagonist
MTPRSDYVDVQLAWHDQAIVVKLRGELDIMTAPALEQELQVASAMGADAIVVDLEDVEFLDCTALRVLLAYAGVQHGSRVAVTPGSRQVRKVLELTGAVKCLNVVAPATEPSGRGASRPD